MEQKVMSPVVARLPKITENISSQLDSIRGLAAISVVIGHANQVLIAPFYERLSPWLGLLAQSSVMIFFVLSGFLIGKSISSNIAKNGGALSLKKYLGDRIIRIWPPLLLSIALLILLYQIAPFVFASGSRAFLSMPGHALARQEFTYEPMQLLGAAVAVNGFFTDTPNSNGALWSLSIEVWYYLLAAIVAWPKRWWKLASIPAVAALLYVGWNNDQFYYYLPVWWAGYLISILHNRSVLPPAKYLWLAATVFLFPAIFFATKTLTVEDARTAWHFLVLYNIATGLCFSAILALILVGSAKFTTIFRSAAPYSYTLYIIHMPILLFLFGIVQPWMQRSVLLCPLIAVGSVVCIIAIARLAALVVENRNKVKSFFIHAAI